MRQVHALYRSSCWEKDARVATWPVLVQQEPGPCRVGLREHRDASSQGFRKETAFA